MKLETPMMQHLRYYVERIAESRRGGPALVLGTLAREFVRDYGSQLTHNERRNLGLVIPFIRREDFQCD